MLSILFGKKKEVARAKKKKVHKKKTMNSLCWTQQMRGRLEVAMEEEEEE